MPRDFPWIQFPYKTGALASPAPDYDALIKSLQAMLGGLEKWWTEFREGDFRAAEQYEVDFAQMTHVTDLPGERFHGPRSALALAVGLRRAREGWDWLPGLASEEELRRAWGASIAEQTTPPTLAELEALAATSDARAFATAVSRSDCAFAADLVVQFFPRATHGELGELLGALATMGTPSEVQAWVTAAVGSSSLDLVRQVALARAAPTLSVKEKERKPYIEVVLGALESRAVDVHSTCMDALKKVEAISVSRALAEDLLKVARSSFSPIAAGAVATLQLAGVDVDSESAAVLASDDQDDRTIVLAAHAARPSEASRPLLRHAVRADAHFACRLNAAVGLSENAGDEDRRLILGLGNDRSGPVRAECARLIGDFEWEEGRVTLLHMLRDRQNANPDDLTVFASPEYRVARVAAEALGKFPSLRDEEVDELLAFVREGKGASDDIQVHRSVLTLLRASDHRGVVPLLVDQLRSMWRMEGTVGSGYPLRYAAAYALVALLGRVGAPPSDEATLSALESAAEHSDERLAAPALVALGFAGEPGCRHGSLVLKHEETTPERALLYAAAYAAKTREMPHAAIFGEMARQPGWRTISHAVGHPATTDAQWQAHLEACADEKAWIEHIAAPSQIHAALRGVLASLLLENVTVIPSEEFREGELPEVVPMFTLHQRW